MMKLPKPVDNDVVIDGTYLPAKLNSDSVLALANSAAKKLHANKQILWEVSI
jgi:hypothetical protein